MTLFKPATGKVTPSIVDDVLMLIGIVLPTNLAKDWTQSQRDLVYDYAIRIHLRAAGNRVKQSPRPKFL